MMVMCVRERRREVTSDAVTVSVKRKWGEESESDLYHTYTRTHDVFTCASAMSES